MRILWANAARASLISGMGAAFMFVGTMFISMGCVFVCYEIYGSFDRYALMSTYIICLVVIKKLILILW